MRRDADGDERCLLDERALLLELPARVLGIVGEHLEIDRCAQAELGGGDRAGAGEAVVRRGRDPGAQRVGDAQAGDRDHVRRP